MEFLTPKQKKERTRRLFVGYGLFAVLISLATYILISTALGYEIFTTKGQVIQNGLLFINSRPSNADIFVDGKKESSNTDAKLSLPEGLYNISLKKPGYKEWRDKVTLSGGNVKFVNYPRLFPIKPIQLANIPYQNNEPTSTLSKDKKWLFVGMADSQRFAEVYDIDNPNTPPIIVSLPESLLAGQKGKLVEFIEWAGDNRHFLVKVDIGGSISTVLLDKDDLSEAVDTSQMFGLVPSDTIGFWDSKWDKIYIHHQAGTVQLGNVKDKSIASSPLISDPVIELFVIGGERAVYTVAQTDADLNVKFLTNNKSYIFTSLKKSTNPLLVESVSFNRNEYVAIAGGSLEKTLLFRNLENQIKKSSDTRLAPFVTLPSRSNYIEFSRSNRILLGSDGIHNSIYDLEDKEVYKYAIPTKAPSVSGWFDDSRIYSVGSDKSFAIYDFNGSNINQVAPLINGIPFVNKDITRTAYFVPATNSQSLRFIDIDTATK